MNRKKTPSFEALKGLLRITPRHLEGQVRESFQQARSGLGPCHRLPLKEGIDQGEDMFEIKNTEGFARTEIEPTG